MPAQSTNVVTGPLGPVLEARFHLEGCPASRTECITTTTPSGVVRIVRCCDCGGYTKEN